MLTLMNNEHKEYTIAKKIKEPALKIAEGEQDKSTQTYDIKKRVDHKEGQ